MRHQTFAAIGLLIIASATAMADNPKLDRIKPSAEKTHFVLEGTDEKIILWGFNYDHDAGGRLIEDYWRDEWETIAGDFREMKDLGANVVRIHLQFGRFMVDPKTSNPENLERLGRLIKLAETTGLYLDITGLACYHKQDVPPWYTKLSESDRWAAQGEFWKAVVAVCKSSPAIFCYDLMNEPILTGGDDPGDWLPGKPFADSHFVQRITLDTRGRTEQAIAKAWVETLTTAIRSVDDATMITVGVIPWAQVFKGAKPLFYDPEVGKTLDFVSVHLYPKAGKLEDDLEVLKLHDVGKPIVVEEIAPISATLEENEKFIARSRDRVDGWISFYWGKTIAEYEKANDGSPVNAFMSTWLRRFQELSPNSATPIKK